MILEEDNSIKKSMFSVYILAWFLNLLVISCSAFAIYSGHTEFLALAALIVIANIIFSFCITKAWASKMKHLKNEIVELSRERDSHTNSSAIQVLRVQEEEREKISFTLHDSVGQYLTVMRWGLFELKKRSPLEKDHIENLTKTCDDIIHEIRSISHDLMPTLIRDFGCCLAIKDYFEKQKQIVPLDMHFTHSEELDGEKFGREFDVNLYRMVQEFFQNTLKHSGARSIKLDLKKNKSTLELLYHDDGKGMDVKKPLPASLNYRAQLFGGEMTRVNYDKGLGFKVIFNLKEIGHEAD